VLVDFFFRDFLPFSRCSDFALILSWTCVCRWGKDLLTPTAADYVSVRWTGFIRPASTGSYTFYIDADDAVRLYIDGTLVIDTWKLSAPGMEVIWKSIKFVFECSLVFWGVIQCVFFILFQLRFIFGLFFHSYSIFRHFFPSSLSRFHSIASCFVKFYFISAHPTGEQSGTFAFPTANLLYDIVIEYRENTDNAHLIFKWACATASLSKELVPNSALFVGANNIVNSPFLIQVCT
jgi:hypothetical protein